MSPVTSETSRLALRSMLNGADACLQATCDGSSEVPDGIVDDLLAARLLVSTALLALELDGQELIGEELVGS